jgi:hypothetical protein
VDIDAHAGQTDSSEACRIISVYLRAQCWSERSARGYHVIFIANKENLTCTEFRALTRELGKQFSQTLSECGITSTVELKGGFADRGAHGDLFRLPRPIDETDARELVELEPLRVGFLRSLLSGSSADVEIVPAALFADDDPNAFTRAGAIKRRFTREHGRDPRDVDELNTYYTAALNTDAGDNRRLARLQWWIDHSDFEPNSQSCDFARQRETLSRAIAEHVAPEHRRGLPRCVTDEELLVVLWVISANSFCRADDPARQFGNANAAFAAAFEVLKNGGVISRAPKCRKKFAACRIAIERAGLIQTVDSGWRVGGRHSGAGKKYTVGANHPRYKQWLEEFSGAPVRIFGRRIFAAPADILRGEI